MRSSAAVWGLERARNPAVLRLHTTIELTRATIETLPPGRAPWPLEGLLSTPGLRSMDLHRYRARLNLAPGTDPALLEARVGEILSPHLGPPVELPAEPPTRAFAVGYRGPRAVAESPVMARAQPVLRAVFLVPGVAEAILTDGTVQVRVGRLFGWDQVEEAVREALRPLST
ncbi:MAG: hypothetical protein ACRDHV_02295 [Actinomycetota bacterium]